MSTEMTDRTCNQWQGDTTKKGREQRRVLQPEERLLDNERSQEKGRECGKSETYEEKYGFATKTAVGGDQRASRDGHV